jgi:TRAP-type uncharacterized transport system substrate-binding protein
MAGVIDVQLAAPVTCVGVTDGAPVPPADVVAMSMVATELTTSARATANLSVRVIEDLSGKRLAVSDQASSICVPPPGQHRRKSRASSIGSPTVEA